MKIRFYTQTLVALAAAITAATSNLGCAEERPIPPPSVLSTPPPPATPVMAQPAAPIAPAATFNAAPAAAPVLPPEISADTSLAQVVRLVQAGVDLSVVTNYIANVPTPFNLDAEKIITLTDSGVPSAAMNAMIERDKVLFAAANNPPASAPAVVTKTVVVADTAPPAAPITVNYFSDTLAPYGTWVNVDGYGRCWRPTVVNYDAGWRPYCDRGHWVYTDCGWYWDSDYSWGATFHYGRWFRNSHLGWCWYPDTEWAPSWVTWRSCDDYRGWAPLPPFAAFHSGGGFVYRDENVSVSFGFGLGADCFTFVSPSHFFDHHPRRFCPEERQVTQIFNRTTIINNYDVHHDRDDRNDRGNGNSGGDRNNRGNRDRIVNNGLSIAQVGRDEHRQITPVQVATLPNASRQGWRSNDEAQPGTRPNDRGNSNRRDNGNQVAGDTTAPTAPQAGGRNDRANQGGSDARPGGNGNQRNNRNEVANQGGRNPPAEDNRNNRPAPVIAPQNNSSAPVVTTPPQNGNRNDRGNRNDNADNRNGRTMPIITPPAQVVTAPPVQVQTGSQPGNGAGQKQNSDHMGARLGSNGNGRPATAIIPPHNPQPVIITPAQNLERNDRANRGNNENAGNRSEPQNRNRIPVVQPTPVPPPARAIQQIEQRPPVEISRPTPPERREQNVAPRNESPRNEAARSESRPSRVESAPRSFTPPPVVQAPAPAPAPSQPAARSENQSRSSERNAERNSSRDDTKERNDKRNR